MFQFEVLKVDGPNLVTDRGCVALQGFSYADGGKTQPVSHDDWAKMRALFIASPALLNLYSLVVTMREEQVSGQMGFGGTESQKKERAAIYAARIKAAAASIDPAIEKVAELLTEHGL